MSVELLKRGPPGPQKDNHSFYILYFTVGFKTHLHLQTKKRQTIIIHSEVKFVVSCHKNIAIV